MTNRWLVPTLVFICLVVAVVGSLGAPLITAVAVDYGVSLSAAQWTLTIALLSGAVATPILGRLGSGPRRRAVVLTTLAAVVAGSALTVLPLPFAALLIGRGAQGLGLGLTALMMATARDHLDPRRSASTIALLSVASTAGIGVGYPLAGLLTDLGGVRAAYGLGLAVTTAALIAAATALPRSRPGTTARVDLVGGTLLTVALLGLLLVISNTDLWRRHLGVTVAVLTLAVVGLVGWVRYERRAAAPLVDVRLLRHPAVAFANVVMFTGGIGMYLLLTLISRFVQTPDGVGYGFGLDTFQAGLILVPFSVLGFVAGRFVPRMRERAGARAVLSVSTASVLAAFVLFAVARGCLVEPVVEMSLLGVGVGAFSAAMPALILSATPLDETASAMSFNQVVRGVGFSLGSAIGSLVLTAYTTGGHGFPSDAGYTAAAWTGAAVMALTLVLIVVRRDEHRRDHPATARA